MLPEITRVASVNHAVYAAPAAIDEADTAVAKSTSAVGHCGDNAPAEGFFGMLKRERVNRRRYLTVRDARSDVFDDIECFHNPRIQRRLESRDREVSTLPHPSAITG